MILTNLYIAEKAPDRKTRFDVTRSTFDHDFLESLLVSKRDPEKGLSLYLVNRPKKFKGTDVTDKAVTKGSFNISSIYFPDPEIPIGYGDINGTEDAIIFRINKNTEKGILKIEMFIAIGQKYNKRNLYFLFVDRELDHEVAKLLKQATPF
jgi:hypothetical protein